MSVLDEERSNINFDQKELSRLIYMGKEKYEEHETLVKYFSTDPALIIDHKFYDLSRDEQINFNFSRQKRMIQLSKMKNSDFPEMAPHTIGKLGDYFGNLIPLTVNYAMFEYTIRLFGSEEQHRELLPKIANLEINGCYAQTEIGHGSDISSLETTATYDKVTETFTINSPTITSGKFWPGELGLLATHAVFHAQLIIDGKRYGVQTFVCQVRDLDSHRPLKNLEIGDIGPKGGFQQKDNGYMYFRNLVLPRSALLSKYTKVSKDGVFSLIGTPKFAYSAMMYVRLYLISTGVTYPAKALIIGIRYSLLRKQFKSLNEGTIERKILDYQTQQAALTPICAFVFAARFTASRMLNLYTEMMDKINKKGDYKLLKEFHSLGSCLKAHFTDRILEYIKVVRE